MRLARFPRPAIGEWRRLADLPRDGLLYTDEDLRGLTHLQASPGSPPYVRGSREMPEPWQIRQEVDDPRLEIACSRLAQALQGGQPVACLRVADPEIGQEGVPIERLADLERVLEPVEGEPLVFRAGGRGPALLAFALAWSRRRGVCPPISVAWDPLAALAAAGELPWEVEGLYRETARLAEALPAPVRLLVADGTVYRRAGASAVQELAFALATGTEHLRALVGEGVPVEEAARLCEFRLTVSLRIFPEMARLRAARMLWWRVVQGFGGNGRMFLEACSNDCDRSLLDRPNNLVRAALEAFVAVVGGCDALSLAPYEASEAARRLARNQHLLLLHEAQLHRVLDPGGGSYYLERLTAALAQEVWDLYRQVEGEGGMLRALRAGLPQERIRHAAARRFEEVRRGHLSMVGVNRYADPAEEIPEEPACRRSGAEEVVGGALPPGPLLEALVRVAREGMPAGAVIAALRRGLGPGPRVEPLVPLRFARPFEELRRRARRSPRAVARLVLAGPPEEARLRARFAADYLATGGIRTVEPEAVFGGAREAARDARRSGARLLVLCAADHICRELAEALGEGLLVAVCSPEAVPGLRAAGVEEFLLEDSDRVDVLSRLLERLEVAP